MVESAGESSKEDSRGESKSHEKGAAHKGYNCCREGSPAAEEREEPDENFDGSGDGRNNVGNCHPLCDGLVGLQTVVELFAKHAACDGCVQAPYFDGIEPEIALSC